MTEKKTSLAEGKFEVNGEPIVKNSKNKSINSQLYH